MKFRQLFKGNNERDTREVFTGCLLVVCALIFACTPTAIILFSIPIKTSVCLLIIWSMAIWGLGCLIRADTYQRTGKILTIICICVAIAMNL